MEFRVGGVIDGALIVVNLEMLPNQRLLLERLIPRNTVLVITPPLAAADAAALLRTAQNPVTDLAGLDAVIRNQNVNAEILAAVAAHRNADARILLNVARNNITNTAGLTAVINHPNVNAEVLAVVEHHPNVGTLLAIREAFSE